MRYSLFGNFSHAKTYPVILNISPSISIAHQSIDILKFSVCHLHYTMHVLKSIEWKKIASSGTQICALQTAFPVAAAVLPLTQNLKSL